MKAVIIAAGKGERIKTLTEPKPLVNLLGLTLIERVILSAKKAGITEFVIVTGYLGNKIKTKIGNGKRYNVQINYVENKEWHRGNGLSVLCAKKLVNDKFILLMADHVFESEIITGLVQTHLENGECILCIDTDGSKHIDIIDATKVFVENDRIVEIGKNLERYNGIDCGIFLLSPTIFDALAECIKNGKEELTHAIKVLAHKKLMRTYDINKSFWIDIDTEESYKKAEEMICKKLIKPTDGIIARILNRPLSIRISKTLVNTKISPNAISICCFISGVVAGAVFCIGNYFAFIVAGLLAQFTSIIDGCDGEIARLKFQQSEYGAWFDSVLDRYADAAIIFGMIYGGWVVTNNNLIWLVGFAALAGTFMNSYTAPRYDAYIIKRKKAALRIGRDLRLFIIMIGALLNALFFTLVFLAILTNAEAIRRLFVLK